MLRRIIHQYKRMLFGGTLLTLTLCFALYAMDQFDAGMVERLQTPEGLIAIAVLSFGFIALCTALLAAFTPRFLDVIEVLLISLALTALIVTVLERIMPPLMALIGPNLPKPRDLTHWGEVAAWAEWSILFACFCLVCRFSIGPCPDWMRSNAGPYRGRFTSPEPPEEAWKLLYPLPGQLERYFYPDSIVSAAPRGAAPISCFKEKAISRIWSRFTIIGRDGRSAWNLRFGIPMGKRPSERSAAHCFLRSVPARMAAARSPGRKPSAAHIRCCASAWR